MAELSITPDPTDEEVAAIVAAVQIGLARPAAAVSAEPVPRWRWSGRWWSAPIAQRRMRP